MPVKKFLVLIAILAGLVVSSMSVLSDETPAQTSIQSATSGDTAGKFSGPGNDSPALQQTTGLDPAAATQAWLNSVPRDKREKSDAYFEGGYWLILWNYLVAAGISILLLSSRISARLRDFSERLTRYKTLQVACYSAAVFAARLCLEFSAQRLRALLSRASIRTRHTEFPAVVSGAVDWSWHHAHRRHDLLHRAVRCVPASTENVVDLGNCVSRSFSRSFLLFIAPVFIEPLFNTYKPLTKPEISEPILVMARANQIPVKQVFEVDASRQTTRVSANVSGILGTTRIALNDNLLKQCTVPEIRAVMAHEMGHYVLNHGAKLLTYLGIFVLIGFALTRILFDAAVRRWGEKWGVRGIADPAGLPLLVLIFSTLLFLATPLLNTVVRVTEREADAFGINTAREPDGMAEVALKLGAYRKLNPTPLEEFIFYDHPSGRARIRMAMDWKAANLSAGQSAMTESDLSLSNH